MALRSKKFTVGQKVLLDNVRVTVIEDQMKQPMGTVNIRDQFGYTKTVKARELKEAD